MNNKGWGLKEFIILLVALAFCLVVVVYLCNKLKKIDEKNKFKNISTEFVGNKDINLKTYIDIEDKMVEASKKYKVDENTDIVIIKLSGMIEYGYINIIRDPKTNKECSGYVIYDNSKKNYKAYLSCAGSYQTSDYNAQFE